MTQTCDSTTAARPKAAPGARCRASGSPTHEHPTPGAPSGEDTLRHVQQAAASHPTRLTSHLITPPASPSHEIEEPYYPGTKIRITKNGRASIFGSGPSIKELLLIPDIASRNQSANERQKHINDSKKDKAESKTRGAVPAADENKTEGKVHLVLDPITETGVASCSERDVEERVTTSTTFTVARTAQQEHDRNADRAVNAEVLCEECRDRPAAVAQVVATSDEVAELRKALANSQKIHAEMLETIAETRKALADSEKVNAEMQKANTEMQNTITNMVLALEKMMQEKQVLGSSTSPSTENKDNHDTPAVSSPAPSTEVAAAATGVPQPTSANLEVLYVVQEREVPRIVEVEEPAPQPTAPLPTHAQVPERPTVVRDYFGPPKLYKPLTLEQMEGLVKGYEISSRLARANCVVRAYLKQAGLCRDEPAPEALYQHLRQYGYNAPAPPPLTTPAGLQVMEMDMSLDDMNASPVEASRLVLAASREDARFEEHGAGSRVEQDLDAIISRKRPCTDEASAAGGTDAGYDADESSDDGFPSNFFRFYNGPMALHVPTVQPPKGGQCRNGRTLMDQHSYMTFPRPSHRQNNGRHRAQNPGPQSRNPMFRQLEQALRRDHGINVRGHDQNASPNIPVGVTGGNDRFARDRHRDRHRDRRQTGRNFQQHGPILPVGFF